MLHYNIRRDISYAFLLSFFVYAPFVFLPAFHIDDELSSLYGTIAVNIAMGRWVTSFIRVFIIPGPFNGYFSAIFSLIVFSISAVVFADALKMRGWNRAVCAGLFIAFPQFCYQLEFHVQSDVVAIGLLLSCCTMHCLDFAERSTGARCIAAFILFCCLTILSTAIYQCLILVPASICLLKSIIAANSGDRLSDIIRRLLIFMTLSIFSVTLYVLLSRYIQYRSGIPAEQNYFTSQFFWNKATFTNVLYGVYGSISQFYLSRNYFGEGIYANALLPAAVLIASSLRRFDGRSLLSLCLVTVAFLSPYTLVILLGSSQTARTFISQGLMFAGLWAIAIPIACGWMSKLRQDILAPVVITTFALAGAFTVSRLTFCDYIQLQADMVTGQRVASDVYRKYPSFSAETQPVFFYGLYRKRNFWRKDNYDAFGGSFFDWDGPTDRINAFMALSGIADFHAPSIAQRVSLADKTKALPTWPDPGAIELVDGQLLIHLGRDPTDLLK